MERNSKLKPNNRKGRQPSKEGRKEGDVTWDCEEIEGVARSRKISILGQIRRGTPFPSWELDGRCVERVGCNDLLKAFPRDVDWPSRPSSVFFNDQPWPGFMTLMTRFFLDADGRLNCFQLWERCPDDDDDEDEFDFPPPENVGRIREGSMEDREFAAEAREAALKALKVAGKTVWRACLLLSRSLKYKEEPDRNIIMISRDDVSRMLGVTDNALKGQGWKECLLPIVEVLKCLEVLERDLHRSEHDLHVSEQEARSEAANRPSWVRRKRSGFIGPLPAATATATATATEFSSIDIFLSSDIPWKFVKRTHTPTDGGVLQSFTVLYHTKIRVWGESREEIMEPRACSKDPSEQLQFSNNWEKLSWGGIVPCSAMKRYFDMVKHEEDKFRARECGLFTLEFELMAIFLLWGPMRSLLAGALSGSKEDDHMVEIRGQEELQMISEFCEMVKELNSGQHSFDCQRFYKHKRGVPVPSQVYDAIVKRILAVAYRGAAVSCRHREAARKKKHHDRVLDQGQDLPNDYDYIYAGCY